MWLILTVVVTVTSVAAEPPETIFTTGGSGEVDISYPANVYSERGLAVCVSNATCSVLHRRFWSKIKVDRLCRCPNMYECPQQWSEHHGDNTTMILNNRSQLKFCQNIAEFPECSARQVAITTTARTEEVQMSARHNMTTVHTSVVVSCYCSPHHYWKLHRERQQGSKKTVFRCTKLRKCAPMEFCGNIRADHYSTYYRCSCPINHLCLFADRNLYNATELLYNGLAYKGVCYPQ